MHIQIQIMLSPLESHLLYPFKPVQCLKSSIVSFKSQPNDMLCCRLSLHWIERTRLEQEAFIKQENYSNDPSFQIVKEAALSSNRRVEKNEAFKFLSPTTTTSTHPQEQPGAFISVQHGFKLQTTRVSRLRVDKRGQVVRLVSQPLRPDKYARRPLF